MGIFSINSSGDSLSAPLALNDAFGGGSLRQTLFGREQMQWQSAENERDRAHQQAMAEQAQRYWQDQFNMTNAYNDPRQQVRRLLAAGISPQALFGNGVTSGSSAATPQSGTLPSSHGVSAVGLPSANPLNGVEMLNGVVGLVRSLFQNKKDLSDSKRSTAEGRKASAEADVAEQTVSDMVHRIRVENDQKELLNEWQKISNEIADKTKDDKIREASARVEEILANKYNLMMSGDKNLSQGLLADMQQINMRIHNEMDSKTLAAFETLLQQRIEQNEADIALSKGRTDAAKASATLYRAEAMTENSIRNYKVASAKWESELMKYEKDFQGKIQKSRYEAYIADLEAKKLIPKEMAEDIRRKVKENDWYEVHQIQAMVNDVIDGFSKIKGINVSMANEKMRERYLDYKYKGVKRTNISEDSFGDKEIQESYILPYD